MALAQIIDLDEVRKARRAQAEPVAMTSVGPSNDALMPVWCYVWMPMYWYIA